MTDFKWSNCDNSAGLIIDNIVRTIEDGNVMHVLQRFHTTVDLFTAIVAYNVTVTMSGTVVR